MKPFIRLDDCFRDREQPKDYLAKELSIFILCSLMYRRLYYKNAQCHKKFRITDSPNTKSALLCIDFGSDLITKGNCLITHKTGSESCFG